LKLFRAALVDAPTGTELIAALPSAVLVVDPSGCIQSANAAAEAFFNMSEGHLVGRPFGSLINLPQRFDGDTDSPLVAYGVDVSTRKASGLRVDIASTPLVDRPGWRIVMLHRETVAQRMGQVRDRSGARAAVSMAAILAHEVKNPLSGIRGAAQLLEGELSSPQRSDLIP